jgi:hypothetical protein
MHTAAIRRISTDDAGRLVLTVSGDKTAKLWSLQDGEVGGGSFSCATLRRCRRLMEVATVRPLFAGAARSRTISYKPSITDSLSPSSVSPL